MHGDSAKAFGFREPQRSANFASQIRVAFSSIAWKTGPNSPGDELMTLQHVRCRRLLLQRLAQFGEQPRILDGYHGLGGKVLQQRNLLFGKRANFRRGKR